MIVRLASLPSLSPVLVLVATRYLRCNLSWAIVDFLVRTQIQFTSHIFNIFHTLQPLQPSYLTSSISLASLIQSNHLKKSAALYTTLRTHLKLSINSRYSEFAFRFSNTITLASENIFCMFCNLSPIPPSPTYLFINI